MPIGNQIVVGMSGHIDHGKTALVKALTGKDTDILDQEKARGMTIDIGFAFLDSKITIIDVPGHEKFVKNMMSGCSGIDIAVLVVAADDGVMPQTREHFEIIKLLDVKYGFVVLNKIDLVESDWIELVLKDIEELTVDSFMSKPKVIQTSAVNDIGLDEVKNHIAYLSNDIPPKKDSGLFRMHIDRSFSKTGFGTIVTGTVSSGCLNVGEMVEILPSGVKSKVRNIQTHGRDVDKAIVGERAAINLNNISSSDLSRGYHLSVLDSYKEVESFIAEISLINIKENNIKSNQRVRIHLGTKEVMARVGIIKHFVDDNVDKIIAHIKLEDELVVGLGDRFIVRHYSPVVTIAGGIVFDKCSNNSWKGIKKLGLDLAGKPIEDRIYSIIYNIPLDSPLQLCNVQSVLNMSEIEFNELLDRDDRYEIITYKTISWVIPKNKILSLKNRLMEIISSFHNNNQMVEGCNKKILFQKSGIEENLLTYLLDEMSKEKSIKVNLNYWSLFDFNIGISKDDLIYKEKILDYIFENNFIDISNGKFLLDNSISKEVFFGIVGFLETEHKIIKIDSNIFVSQEKLKAMKSSTYNFLSKHDSISVPEFKELNQLTRKFAIPVLEYLDKINYTYRFGNERKLSEGPK